MKKKYLLVTLVAAVTVAAIALGAWQISNQKTSTNATPITNTPVAEQPKETKDLFKISEFGVGFTQNSEIHPLYYVLKDGEFNGVKYDLIKFSVQELVDAGKKELSGGNACNFNTTPSETSDHPIVTVGVFSSKSDLLNIQQESVSPSLTEADMITAKGYFNINDKWFAVPVPGTVQRGSGPCLEDVDIENAFRLKLQESLMTLEKL